MKVAQLAEAPIAHRPGRHRTRSRHHRTSPFTGAFLSGGPATTLLGIWLCVTYPAVLCWIVAAPLTAFGVTWTITPYRVFGSD